MIQNSGRSSARDDPERERLAVMAVPGSLGGDQQGGDHHALPSSRAACCRGNEVVKVVPTSAIAPASSDGAE